STLFAQTGNLRVQISGRERQRRSQRRPTSGGPCRAPWLLPCLRRPEICECRFPVASVRDARSEGRPRVGRAALLGFYLVCADRKSASADFRSRASETLAAKADLGWAVPRSLASTLFAQTGNLRVQISGRERQRRSQRRPTS